MKNNWMPLGSRIAPAAVALALLDATLTLAQGTPYGEDAIPNASESLRPWAGYGTDPVPMTAIDNQGSIRAYGFDPVPTAPTNKLDVILPCQTLQVLTGAVEGASPPGPCAP